MASTTHGEVRSSFCVVASKRDESAVCCKHRVHFSSNDGFNFSRHFIVANKALNLRGLWLVRIANEQALCFGVINGGALKRINIFCRNDDLQSINGSYFIAESSLGEKIKRQVITEIFARFRKNFEAQSKLCAFGFCVAEFKQLHMCFRRN